MSRRILSDQLRQGPNIQMAPLIDIIFNVLVVFMAISVFAQLETEINISVPKAKDSKQMERDPGEIIINISKEGDIVVNERKLTYDDLTAMLKKVATLFPNQPIIIRADERTYHRYVIKVLDACAGADIWNISFATMPEGGQI
jgi:biopolymer transport protein ExbD